MERPDALSAFAARVRGARGREKLDATAAAVFAAFADAGVEALLLKGPALAQMLYDEGESRGYSDVDVLVAPAGLQRARAALARAGYTEVSSRLGIDDVAAVVHDETWVGADPDGYETVDLHLRLPGATAPAERVWSALAAHATAIDVGGREVPVLRREGLALHVALHAAQHGAAHAKGLVDLQLALERWPEPVWRDAAALAGEVGAEAAFAAGLALLEPGAHLAGRLGLPSVAAPWRRGAPRGSGHLDALGAAGGLRARAGIVRRALLPRPAWIRYTYPWAHGGRVRLLAAYAVHLARAPAWALRAWRFRRSGG